MNKKRGVMLGRDILSVGLLAKLDLPHVVAARFEETDLGGGVFRRVVEQPRGHEDRAAMRQARVHEQIDAGLFDFRVAVDGAVPGIGRGGDDLGLHLAIRGMGHAVLQASVAIERARVKLADGKAKPVADIG